MDLICSFGDWVYEETAGYIGKERWTCMAGKYIHKLQPLLVVLEAIVIENYMSNSANSLIY